MDYPNLTLSTPALPRLADAFPGAALFDLDGTLIDSLPDITLAVGELMASADLPVFTEAEVREMVGYGLRVLVERAFAARHRRLDAAGLEIMSERMREIYAHHLTGRTRLMPGALEAIEMLARAGSALALVTNKLQSAANIVLEHFELSERFQVIIGDQARPFGLSPKPSPDMLQFALTRLAVAAPDAMMFGDSAADIRSATAAGVFSVALRNGYSTVPLETLGPGVVIETLLDMPAAIEAWRRA
ncbi:MAG: HAD-IA family hydrolase [Devosia nanyangense]|uniref:phosphoglycolate phosphatase n=1 Tax=Devosia nanyangense TaxID=1228055 RepID=A0A933L4K5_9HYPH|nr:HAD-IA family hydrolase [Devosia nanyangense]